MAEQEPESISESEPRPTPHSLGYLEQVPQPLTVLLCKPTEETNQPRGVLGLSPPNPQVGDRFVVS